MEHWSDNHRQVGTDYEQRAAEFLRAKGCLILEKNYRTRLGEIDLIALDDKDLVFVEVKYRASNRFGTAAAAVDRRKQATIYRVAEQYLHQHGFDRNTSCRFDVVAISGTQIEHYENAFGGL